MIVASLLLILVAVALLVLGLTGGSSNLLISSIAASLLAAVALVIGARQAAVRRTGNPEPSGPVPAPEPEDAFVAEPEFAAAQRLSYPATAPDHRETVQFDSSGVVEPGDLSADEAHETGWADEPRAPARPRAGDYDQAADVITAARTANPGENAWRRDPDAAPSPDDFAPQHDDFASQHDDFGSRADDFASAAGEPDEFAEPDADDPDDEPLPQSVSPADAVRVARLDAEVLVVDGRPRYHMADCPHLVGKLTEPIPVNEAVELGFSPCGLCRPVDRLVAAAAHS